jgi:hypothetical protein
LGNTPGNGAIRAITIVAKQAGQRTIRAAGSGILRHSIEWSKHPRPDVKLISTFGI